MPNEDKILENWLKRFENLTEENKKHIRNAVQKYDIHFTSEEQVEDFLRFAEMADVLFNDEVSTLSFVHIPNQEALVIVDEGLKVYKTISYNPFEPSDQDLLDA